MNEAPASREKERDNSGIKVNQSSGSARVSVSIVAPKIPPPDLQKKTTEQLYESAPTQKLLPTLKPPLAPKDLDENFPIVLESEKIRNGIQMLPSGAYATNDTSLSVRRNAPRKTTVFSLAAMESLDANNGFRSGVFGLRQQSPLRANSVQKPRILKPVP